MKIEHAGIELIDGYQFPAKTIYAALHQDYYGFPVCHDESWQAMREEWYQTQIIKLLLNGNRGHYGPLEHPTFTFNAWGFDHRLVQQLRTHRVGISFDVMSLRYNSEMILDIAELDWFEASRLISAVKSTFWIRPVGEYTDRQGKKYEVTTEDVNEQIVYIHEACKYYAELINKGYSEEHAASFLPMTIRQHFVFSVNVRSLLHLLDVRLPKDAQLEIRCFMEMLYIEFEKLLPLIAQWYKENRYGKKKLAP
jgi:thymidylate synthase (FAD)